MLKNVIEKNVYDLEGYFYGKKHNTPKVPEGTFGKNK